MQAAAFHRYPRTIELPPPLPAAQGAPQVAWWKRCCCVCQADLAAGRATAEARRKVRDDDRVDVGVLIGDRAVAVLAKNQFDGKVAVKYLAMGNSALSELSRDRYAEAERAFRRAVSAYSEDVLAQLRQTEHRVVADQDVAYRAHGNSHPPVVYKEAAPIARAVLYQCLAVNNVPHAERAQMAAAFVAEARRRVTADAKGCPIGEPASSFHAWLDRRAHDLVIKRIEPPELAGMHDRKGPGQLEGADYEAWFNRTVKPELHALVGSKADDLTQCVEPVIAALADPDVTRAQLDQVRSFLSSPKQRPASVAADWAAWRDLLELADLRAYRAYIELGEQPNRAVTAADARRPARVALAFALHDSRFHHPDVDTPKKAYVELHDQLGALHAARRPLKMTQITSLAEAVVNQVCAQPAGNSPAEVHQAEELAASPASREDVPAAQRPTGLPSDREQPSAGRLDRKSRPLQGKSPVPDRMPIASTPSALASPGLRAAAPRRSVGSKSPAAAGLDKPTLDYQAAMAAYNKVLKSMKIPRPMSPKFDVAERIQEIQAALKRADDLASTFFDQCEGNLSATSNRPALLKKQEDVASAAEAHFKRLNSELLKAKKKAVRPDGRG